MSTPVAQQPKKSKKLTWIIFFLLMILVAVGVTFYVVYSERYPSTDDSYVQAHVVNIAPQVSGSVNTVLVKNQQFVKKGQLLFTIDPRPFQYAVANNQAALQLAQEQATRIIPLVKAGQVARSEGDTIQAQVQEAQAALNQAQYNLAQATITAPADGTLANFSVRVGDSVSQGISLFALVEQSEFWVDANFKETDLKRIRVGQSATINIDMYPNYIFKGVVESLNPGSGTEFSLLPPENATGNWVKVTQRVPVRILITNTDPRYPLLVGTSAVTRIDTTTTSKEVANELANKLA
jgi:membrane fusion protein (multidrug efflux system)